MTIMTPSRYRRSRTFPRTIGASWVCPSASWTNTIPDNSTSSAARKARAAAFPMAYGTRRRRPPSRPSTDARSTNACSSANDPPDLSSPLHHGESRLGALSPGGRMGPLHERGMRWRAIQVLARRGMRKTTSSTHGTASSNTSLAARPRKGCRTCACSIRGRPRRCTGGGPTRRRSQASRTARCARRPASRISGSASTGSPRWTPTTSPHGAAAGRPTNRTAGCRAKRTTARRATAGTHADVPEP